ncbi:MAG: nucleotidyltransferase family protein, partial [Thermoplasmata archaeon]
MDRRRPPTVGIVLSAGASRRWEGVPKALLSIGGTPALAVIVGRLAAAVDRIRIVEGPEAEAIRSGVVLPGGAGVEWRINPDRASGPIGSFREGLRDLPEEARVVLWPVDHPCVAPETLLELLAVSDRDP